MRPFSIFTTVAFVAFAACSGAVQDEETVPEVLNTEMGPPLFSEPFTFGTIPKLGTVTLTAGNETITRTTVDFSVGAIDPSAWFETVNGEPTLFVAAFHEDDINLDGEKSVEISATFPSIGPGVSTTAKLEAITNSGSEVVGETQPEFRVFITGITPQDDAVLSRITGTFTGEICAIGDTVEPDCAILTGSFDTLAAVAN